MVCLHCGFDGLFGGLVWAVLARCAGCLVLLICGCCGFVSLLWLIILILLYAGLLCLGLILCCMLLLGVVCCWWFGFRLSWFVLLLVSLGCIFWCLRLASVGAFTTWAFVVSVRFGWFVGLLFMVIRC